MKTLIAIISSALLLASASAFADNNTRNNINNQNLSKRPYQQVPEAPTNKADNFEGATLIKEESQAEKTQKTLQLHNLGRRPYSEKAPD